MSFRRKPVTFSCPSSVTRSIFRSAPAEHFTPGERLTVLDGPFAGLEAVFQIAEGEKRVIVLIEMLARQVKVAVAPGSVRKLAMN